MIQPVALPESGPQQVAVLTILLNLNTNIGDPDTKSHPEGQSVSLPLNQI